VSTPTSLALPTGVRRTVVACDRGTFAALEAIPETGACELDTALLVPGYTGSKEDFLPILGELAYGGRRVVAIDQRGQYETGGPDDPAAYDLAELGKDVAAVLMATEAAHLLGHSFGGLVAREALLTGEVPVASITLMSSGPGAIPGDRAAELRSFLWAVGPTADDPERLRDTVAAIWHKSRKPHAIATGVPPHIVDFLQDRMLGNSATGLVAMARQLLIAPDQTEDLAKLGIPVFVLYGEDDDAWPAAVQEDMAALLEARRECIPGAAHSPAVEAPATTAHALTDFWNFAELARGSGGRLPSCAGLNLSEGVPGAAADGGELPWLAVAQVVTPSAPGTGPGREDLILPVWWQPGPHLLVGVSALGGQALGPAQVPGERLLGVLPRDHLAAGQVVQFDPGAVTAQ
jgi:pimeloyl-ACP methyl ester carboxylesterase